MQKNIFQSILNKYWINIVIMIIITGAILYSYRDLPNIYFMHDEWRAQSGVFIDGITSWINRFSIMQLLLGLNRSKLLGALSNNIIYYFFPFRSDIFIYQFYSLHIANSFLLYFLIKKATKNTTIALLSSLFFATSSTGQQALSWIGAGLQILYTLFFSLISMLFIYQYIKKRNNKILAFALASCYLGYLFKEIGIIALPFLLVAVFHACLKKFSKFFYIIVVGLVLTMISLFFLRSGNIESNIKFVFNCVYYPFISMSQSFIPFRFMYRLGMWFMQFNYPVIAGYNDAPTIIHFIITDLLSIIFSTFIFISLFLVYKKTAYKNFFLVGLAWYFLSFVPISFALFNRNASYIDSRHLYMPMIGISILFAISIEAIVKLIRLHYRKLLTIQFAFLVFFFLFFYKQSSITAREVRETAISGIQMTTFIRAFKLIENSRVMPQKPVYYFSSDRNYYYEGNKLPFLLGSGYVLSVIEYPSGRIPKQVLEKEFLIDFGSQGYIESGDKGYGYYYDIKLLRADVKQGKFLPEQVIGFSYDSQTHEMTDITDKIQNEINK